VGLLESKKKIVLVKWFLLAHMFSLATALELLTINYQACVLLSVGFPQVLVGQ